MKVAIEGAALAQFDFERANQIKGTIMVENSDTLCLTLTMLFCLSHSFKNLSHIGQKLGCQYFNVMIRLGKYN